MVSLVIKPPWLWIYLLLWSYSLQFCHWLLAYEKQWSLRGIKWFFPLIFQRHGHFMGCTGNYLLDSRMSCHLQRLVVKKLQLYLGIATIVYLFSICKMEINSFGLISEEQTKTIYIILLLWYFIRCLLSRTMLDIFITAFL